MQRNSRQRRLQPIIMMRFVFDMQPGRLWSYGISLHVFRHSYASFSSNFIVRNIDDTSWAFSPGLFIHSIAPAWACIAVIVLNKPVKQIITFRLSASWQHFNIDLLSLKYASINYLKASKTNQLINIYNKWYWRLCENV